MANPFTWEYDVADGVWKSREMSKKLMEQAAVTFRIVPFTTKYNGFGKKMGETVTLAHYKDLTVPTSAVLETHTRVPIDKLTTGTRSITVSEMGRGVEYDNLMEQLSVYDPKEMCQKALLKQMKEVMDNAAAAAFKTAKVCAIPTSLTGLTWDTDGTPSSAATVNLTKAHMGIIRDYMVNNLHIPFYNNGDHFIGLFATKALRGLKDDNAVVAWHQYLGKGDLYYRSEVGMVEEIRCVEISQENAFANAIGTGSVLGQGVVFGDEAVTRVEVNVPELRADPNYQSDFGRLKAVIWYGIIAYAITWDTATDKEAKVVRIASS
jgi:N4-gp56 family major capsid protein